MDTNLNFTKALVLNILIDGNREWTIQGFGFLRTYFGPRDYPKRFRLNLWDSKFTVPNVSTIHDHPWDFTSLIVAGKFENQRYDLISALDTPTHKYAVLKTGIGGELDKNTVNICCLSPHKREYYSAGDIYYQKANEIHETFFEDGSVTLNERIGDTEQARVFWPHNANWVDATPRIAKPTEARAAIERSLYKWFK